MLLRHKGKVIFLSNVVASEGYLKDKVHNKSGLQKERIHMALAEGTKENPWKLKTPPQTSEYEIYKDEKDGKEILVCTVGKTVLHYDFRCIDDLSAMLKQHGDWIELGSADEQKPAKEGTIEAWGRSSENPIGGWYGLKKGLRGRFGMYLPPLMEKLGLAEVEHNPRNNRMKSI
ncbi:DUF6855 family protein [Paenibacillus sp. FSL K6-3182]|uniref:DUF6855 family protein n=2 Tax=unclassified Paenibacillus TaxID=185978 RepID=UPI0030CF5D94